MFSKLQLIVEYLLVSSPGVYKDEVIRSVLSTLVNIASAVDVVAVDILFSLIVLASKDSRSVAILNGE